MKIERRATGARARTCATLFAVLALSGCVNPAFRESIGQYGQITKATVEQQNERLSGIAADEQARIRADLIARRVDLRLDETCARLLAAAVVPAGEAAEGDQGQVTECTLREQGGEAVELAPRFEHILSLTAALSDYADSLILLAADATEDKAAFTTSVNQLGTSLGALDGAVRTALGEGQGNDAAHIGAVAGLVAQAGGLYFEQRRASALKAIIIDADPVVQRATEVLADADDALGFYYQAGLAQALLKARRDATETVHRADASDEEVAAAYDDLLEALEAYNRYGEDIHTFQAIGAAHAKLAQAARKGASAQELQAAIEAIIDLAASAHTVLAASDKAEGGSDVD